MAERELDVNRPTDPVGRFLFGTSRLLALLGGVLCSIMAVMVVVSVTGRYLFNSPLPGDYDLVGIISGCAIFAFLPYCQMVRGNIVVDFFTSSAPPRLKSVLDAIGTLLFLAVTVIFTWRLYYGALDLYEQHEVISAFAFYRWWTLPFAIFCMVVLILVIAHSLFGSIANVRDDPAPSLNKERWE
jgi:TRAP-type C4-dicarboxylate transport system permease small subunit